MRKAINTVKQPGDVKDLRELLGDGKKPLSQVSLGRKLGITQKRITAWEGGEKPPCGALVQMGNLAANRGAHDLALRFWKKAGIDTQRAMVRAVKASLGERAADPPKGKVVEVRPLLGEGPSWYVDSKLVPDASAVAYLDSYEGQPSLSGRVEQMQQGARKPSVWEDLARFAPSLEMADHVAEVGGLPPHAGSYLKYPVSPREVVILDTSVSDLRLLWLRMVLVQSEGPPHYTPHMPLRGLYMGRFECNRLDYGLSEFAMDFVVYHEVGSYLPVSRQGSFRLGVYKPELTMREKRLLAEGGPPRYKPTAARSKAYTQCVRSLLERVMREFRPPSEVAILGRVIDWFRPMDRAAQGDVAKKAK